MSIPDNSGKKEIKKEINKYKQMHNKLINKYNPDA